MQCEEKRHVDDSQSTTRILDCVLLEMKGGWKLSWWRRWTRGDGVRRKDDEKDLEGLHP